MNHVLTVIGESGIGKTDLVNALKSKSVGLLKKPKPTGVEEHERRVKMSEGVVCDVWDMGGEAILRADLHPLTMNIPQAKVILFCFDPYATDPFNYFRTYQDIIKKHINKNTKIILVGTRIDRGYIEDRRQELEVHVEHFRSYFASYFEIGKDFCLTSAENGVGIQKLRNQIASLLEPSVQNEEKQAKEQQESRPYCSYSYWLKVGIMVGQLGGLAVLIAAAVLKSLLLVGIGVGLMAIGFFAAHAHSSTADSETTNQALGMT